MDMEMVGEYAVYSPAVPPHYPPLPQAYVYPGAYMFGQPIYSMNGVPMQSTSPLPQNTDNSGSKRRKKRRRRRRRRPGVDEDSEEEEEEEEQWSSDGKELEERASLTSEEGSGRGGGGDRPVPDTAPAPAPAVACADLPERTQESTSSSLSFSPSASPSPSPPKAADENTPLPKTWVNGNEHMKETALKIEELEATKTVVSKLSPLEDVKKTSPSSDVNAKMACVHLSNNATHFIENGESNASIFVIDTSNRNYFVDQGNTFESNTDGSDTALGKAPQSGKHAQTTREFDPKSNTIIAKQKSKAKRGCKAKDRMIFPVQNGFSETQMNEQLEKSQDILPKVDEENSGNGTKDACPCHTNSAPSPDIRGKNLKNEGEGHSLQLEENPHKVKETCYSLASPVTKRHSKAQQANALPSPAASQRQAGGQGAGVGGGGRPSRLPRGDDEASPALEAPGVEVNAKETHDQECVTFEGKIQNCESPHADPSSVLSPALESSAASENNVSRWQGGGVGAGAAGGAEAPPPVPPPRRKRWVARAPLPLEERAASPSGGRRLLALPRSPQGAPHDSVHGNDHDKAAGENDDKMATSNIASLALVEPSADELGEDFLQLTQALKETPPFRCEEGMQEAKANACSSTSPSAPQLAAEASADSGGPSLPPPPPPPVKPGWEGVGWGGLEGGHAERLTLTEAVAQWLRTQDPLEVLLAPPPPPLGPPPLGSPPLGPDAGEGCCQGKLQTTGPKNVLRNPLLASSYELRERQDDTSTRVANRERNDTLSAEDGNPMFEFIPLLKVIIKNCTNESKMDQTKIQWMCKERGEQIVKCTDVSQAMHASDLIIDSGGKNDISIPSNLICRDQNFKYLYSTQWGRFISKQKSCNTDWEYDAIMPENLKRTFRKDNCECILSFESAKDLKLLKCSPALCAANGQDLVFDLPLRICVSRDTASDREFEIKEGASGGSGGGDGGGSGSSDAYEVGIDALIHFSNELEDHLCSNRVSKPISQQHPINSSSQETFTNSKDEEINSLNKSNEVHNAPEIPNDSFTSESGIQSEEPRKTDDLLLSKISSKSISKIKQTLKKKSLIILRHSGTEIPFPCREISCILQ